LRDVAWKVDSPMTLPILSEWAWSGHEADKRQVGSGSGLSSPIPGSPAQGAA